MLALKMLIYVLVNSAFSSFACLKLALAIQLFMLRKTSSFRGSGATVGISALVRLPRLVPSLAMTIEIDLRSTLLRLGIIQASLILLSA